MTRREQLQEQYEDALFALLMDEVASSEGKKALEENEQLMNDPAAAVPEETARRCRRTIRRHFAKQSAAAAGRLTIKVFGKVAMLAGVCAMLFTAAFAASEPLRIETMNLVVQVFGESTDFHFSGKVTSNMYTVVAEWLPEGYVLESRQEDDTGSTYCYQKTEQEYFYLMCIRSNGTIVSSDTEDAEEEILEINGQRATLISEANTIQLIWSTPDKAAFIHLIGNNISAADLIHIAKQLNY